MSLLHAYDITLTPIEVLLAWLAAAFFMSGLAFVILIFAFRVYKSHRLQKQEKLKHTFRKMLNTFIVNESLSSNIPDAATNFQIQELRKILPSDSEKELLIDQILELKKSLAGTSVNTLLKLYRELGLHQQTLSNLKSFSWYVKARSIREIAEMQYVEAKPLLYKYLNSKNSILREETLLALLRLNAEEPLSFLSEYKQELTLWMRINLHHHLQQLDSRKLPLFSKWFMHDNVSTVLFCISMVRAFRQTSSLPGVVGLLKHNNIKIVSLAIETISVLEAYEYCNDVAQLSAAFWSDEKISRRIVHCLGNIGDPHVHGTLLLQYLEHPSYNVRFETVKALQKLGLGNGMLQQGDSPNLKIYKHLSEPLLN